MAAAEEISQGRAGVEADIADPEGIGGWCVVDGSGGSSGEEPLSKDGDRSGGGRVVGVEEEDGVLIALEAGDVVVEGDKGAIEAGHLEGASGVGGPGGGEYGVSWEGLRPAAVPLEVVSLAL